MSRNEVILGACALTLVVFSLVVSMVVPRRNPDFPGRHLKLFTLVCVLLVVGDARGGRGLRSRGGPRSRGAENVATEAQDSGEPTPRRAPRRARRPRPARRASRPAGDPAAGEEIFASAGLRELPHARGRGHDGQHRPEPRRGAAERRGGRRADDARRQRHAGLRRPAQPGGDRRRGRLRGRRPAEASRRGPDKSGPYMAPCRHGEVSEWPKRARLEVAYAICQSRSLGHSDTSPRADIVP